MKKFKFFGIAIIFSGVLIFLGIFLAEHEANTGPKVPDEGLEFLIVIPIAFLVLILGLAVDLYFMFTTSNKSVIQKRKPFWQIISIIGILGLSLLIFRMIAF